jgi:hypothetical protein
LPALQGLQQVLRANRQRCPPSARIVQLAWREVMPGVPALLEQHAASGEVDAVLARLQPQLLHAFDRHARAVLDSHVLASPAPVALVLPAGSGYERVADDLPPSYEKLYEALSQSVLAALEQLADEVAGHCTARLAGLSDAVSVQQDIIEMRSNWQALKNSCGRSRRTWHSADAARGGAGQFAGGQERLHFSSRNLLSC